MPAAGRPPDRSPNRARISWLFSHVGNAATRSTRSVPAGAPEDGKLAPWGHFSYTLPPLNIGSSLAVSLSKRVQKVKPSPPWPSPPGLQSSSRRQDIIGLGRRAGFRHSRPYRRCGRRAIRKGITRYTAVDGTAELKDAIIAKFKRDNTLTYERSQILVSSAPSKLLQCLRRPARSGDECVIPAPYWVSYPDMVLLADGVPVSVYGGADQGYKITSAQLEAAITPRTKMLFSTVPAIPPRRLYPGRAAGLGAVLERHPQVVIASDEMYEHIYWAPEPFFSFAQANPHLYDRTVTINGVPRRTP